MEVVVADGMSDDGTRRVIAEIAADDSRVRMIDNHQRTTPTGLNAAIRAARGEIIVRMDAHTEIAPDYTRLCVETLEHSGAQNVGGPALVKARGYVQRANAAAFHSPFSTGGGKFHRPRYEGEVDTVVFGCWKKSTLLEIGLFDEELVRNQDDELNFRLRQRGGRLWQSPAIRSWYQPRSTLTRIFSQYFQYGFWKVRVIQKRGRPASVRHVVPVLFVAGLTLGWIPALAWSPLWIAYLTILAAYATANAAFSIFAAARTEWRLLPVLPLVFFVYQFSYGLGFAAGMWHFARPRWRQSPSLRRPWSGSELKSNSSGGT
jgi:succinoglycan biosynthesis protein ExoA